MIEWLQVFGGSTLFLGGCYYCIKKIAEMAISKAIEDYKSKLGFDQKKREKAALVAELLSEWLKQPMDIEKVHKLLWEASMWLPDSEAKNLNDLLAHANGQNAKEIIIQIRALIQGGATLLKPEDITHFNEARSSLPANVPGSTVPPLHPVEK